jgi:hypothetical protein
MEMVDRHWEETWIKLGRSTAIDTTTRREETK